jgi:hypothetical protein
MTCDLILDHYGWWLQYVSPEDGKTRCTLMNAANECEAHLEAQEEGFTEMRVWVGDRQLKTVCIPNACAIGMPFPTPTGLCEQCLNDQQQRE